jgi:hypothetical protein
MMLTEPLFSGKLHRIHVVGSIVSFHHFTTFSLAAFGNCQFYE